MPKPKPTVINRQVIDRIFTEQKALSEQAINTVGMKSYMENLGFDFVDVMKFCRSYVKDNMTEERNGITDKQAKSLAAMIARGMALGVVIGREVAQ
jgi:hypothetical protein